MLEDLASVREGACVKAELYSGGNVLRLHFGHVRFDAVRRFSKEDLVVVVEKFGCKEVDIPYDVRSGNGVKEADQNVIEKAKVAFWMSVFVVVKEVVYLTPEFWCTDVAEVVGSGLEELSNAGVGVGNVAVRKGLVVREQFL